MKIKKIIIQNFRGYKKAEIELNNSEEYSGIHTFVGLNSAGKTSFSRALIWAFHGEEGLIGFVSGKKKDKSVDNLEYINRGVWDDKIKKASCSVYVWFEHNGEDYALSRIKTNKIDYPEQNKSNWNQDVFQIVHKGKEVKGGSKAWMARNFPLSSARFFVVDGEDIRKYSEGIDKSVETAIHRLLGQQYLDETIKLLKNRKRKYDKLVLKSKSTDTTEMEMERQKLEKEIIDAKDDIEKNEGEERTKINENLQKTGEEMEKLAGKQEQLDELKELEDKMNGKEEERDELYKKISELGGTKDSAPVFIYSWIKEHVEQIKTSYQDDELDELRLERDKIKHRHGVMTMLSEGELDRCICGEELTDEQRRKISEEEESLAGKIKEKKDLIEEYDRNSPSYSEINDAYESICDYDLKSDLKALDVKIKNVEAEHENLKNDYNALDLELREESHDSKEKSYGELKDLYDHLNIEKGKNINLVQVLKKNRIKNKEKEERLRRQINIALQTENEQKEINAKRNKAIEFIDMFESVVDEFKGKKKNSVEKFMNESFGRLKSKNRAIQETYGSLEIDMSYQIKGKDSEGKYTGLDFSSSGFAELIAFSFIYGLTQETELKLPLVADYPFGKLDEGNAERLANEMEGISDQVILLLHPSEYKPMANLINELSVSLYKLELSDTMSCKISVSNSKELMNMRSDENYE